MTRAIGWTAEMDARLVELRACGRDCRAIGEALGLSKNAVINRLDRLGMPTGTRFRMAAPRPGDDRIEPVLPAGHPVSWGAISNTAWPGVASVPG